MRRKGQRLAATAMALVLITAACGDDDGDDDGASDTTAPAVQESIGEGEGALSVLAWPYYAEDGIVHRRPRLGDRRSRRTPAATPR